MSRTPKAALVFAAALIVSGCGSKNGELVTEICACEHCDDWKEEELVALLDASSDVADAYACDVEYESLVQCQIDEGICDDEEASFSLAKKGRCDTSVQCATDTECAGLGGACGVSGVCDKKLCAGSTTDTCDKDSDCPSEKNRCETEETELDTCINNGSEHHGVSIGD